MKRVTKDGMVPHHNKNCTLQPSAAFCTDAFAAVSRRDFNRADEAKEKWTSESLAELNS
jgi:hypothetical protein